MRKAVRGERTKFFDLLKRRKGEGGNGAEKFRRGEAIRQKKTSVTKNDKSGR